MRVIFTHILYLFLYQTPGDVATEIEKSVAAASCRLVVAARHQIALMFMFALE